MPLSTLSKVISMLGNVPLHLVRVYRSIWFLPSAYALGSIAVLAAAPTISVWMPEGSEDLLPADTLQKILTILASSMLAVAIFSLGTMVSALEAASAAATPRARALLSEDRVAQVAISTFIGAFIFSILGIIGVSTSSYDERSAACIFVFTLLIIAVVIIVMISWIHRLSEIGGVEEAIRMVERKTMSTFTKVSKQHLYHGRSYATAPEGLEPIFSNCFGYLQHIDGEALGKISKDQHVDLYVAILPGELVRHKQPVLLAGATLDEKQRKRVMECFVFGEGRTFEEDPRYGLLVLSEIASRALSPGVNDPGTAIHVLVAIVRSIRHWCHKIESKEVEMRFPRLYVPSLDIAEVIIEGFRWIARDSARHLEVAVHVQKALAELRTLDDAGLCDALGRMSEEAMVRAREVMAKHDFAMLVEHRKALQFDDDTGAAFADARVNQSEAKHWL